MHIYILYKYTTHKKYVCEISSSHTNGSYCSCTFQQQTQIREYTCIQDEQSLSKEATHTHTNTHT